MLVLLLSSICAPSYGDELKEYVFSRGGGQRSMRINGTFPIRDMGKLPEGRYFWFRHKGQSLMIRDEATLQSIDGLFSELRKLAPEFDALRRRMRVVERRESDADRQIDQIDEQIESLEDDDVSANVKRRRELELRSREIRSELREISAQLRVLESAEEELDRKSDALEAKAEAKLVPLVEEAIRRGVAVRVSPLVRR